ncbi:S8/S53 family peptidase [Actinoplanes solisilvae]|uniref:S8/S53 family peptidase n=1 Tax=Actinoplanes solisilvae TaxID=2486853 RepID=UPI0013E2EB6B|nr:S8/S53 family peptidase [Actinoplanes solisilvae]
MEAERYSADTLTADAPADTDKLNDLLEGAGLDRLIAGCHDAGGRQVLTVAGGAAFAAGRALRAAGARDVRHDPLLLGGTMKLSGKHWGHGFTWAELALAREDWPPVPEWQAPPAALRRPVVALLDTGVEIEPGDWLDFPTPDDDPFLIRASFDAALPASEGDGRDAGHATFIAGLIRMAAPSARVLSLRVMSPDGKVYESTVVAALRWLASYVRDGSPVDVVCLPFGREPSDTDPFDDIEMALEPFAAAGIPVVASAGNDHVEEPAVLPAASPLVTAVGAGFGKYHATFSNYGDWVDRYRDGVDVFGPLPGGRWVKWSGTSFAAATFAGDLARPQVSRGHV